MADKPYRQQEERLRGKEASPNFFWTIHVSMTGGDFILRETVVGPTAMAGVFDAAMRYCRDEGWNHFHISRLRR